MFKFKNISKVSLIVSVLLLASFYNTSSFAQTAQAPSELTGGPVGGLPDLRNSSKPGTVAERYGNDSVGAGAVKSAAAAASVNQKSAQENDRLNMLQKSYNQEGYNYRKQLNAAQKAMSEARTPDEITKAQASLKDAQKLYDDYNTDYEEQQKEMKKKAKVAEKEAEAANKKAEKAAKTAVKGAEKELKDSEKELKKAEKDYADGKIDATALASVRKNVDSKKAGLDNLNNALANPTAVVGVASGNGLDENGKIKTRGPQLGSIDSISTTNKQNLDAAKAEFNQNKADYQKIQTAYLNKEKECRADKVNGGTQDNSQACEDAAKLKKDVDAAKDKADNAYLLTQKINQNIKDSARAPQAAVESAEKIKNAAKSEVDKLKKELAEANKACEYSKNLSSKGGQKQADQYCRDAENLEAALSESQKALEEKEKIYSDAIQEQQYYMEQTNPNEMRGMIYQAFETYEKDSKGYNTGSYSGSTDGDVLKTITRRAFKFIVALKPLIYVFAGFGLIAFAFMAIFNKLSWKWFSNIAIGLFLVANMGRFIEYFVFPNDKEDNGKLEYGDYLSKGFADTKYVWVQEMAPYIPPKAIDGQLPDSSAATPEAKKDVRGFCGKTEGASGWANFSKCVKDVTAAGRKAVDTVKTVQSTIEKTKSGIESVKNAAQNIGDAVQNAKGGGLSGIIKAAGQVGSSVNNMVGTTTGVVGGVMSGASKVANNMQDVNKSTDQVSELDRLRAKGEGTNAIDRLLKGQTKGEDGKVERDYKGNIISDANAFNAIEKASEAIYKKTNEGNNLLQGAVRVGYDGAKTSEDLLGVTDKLVKKRQEKAKEASEEKNEERRKAQAQKNAERDDKTVAEQDKKLVDEYKKKIEDQSQTTTDKAKSAVEEAKAAAAQAKRAESEATQKSNAAKQAENERKSKETAAENAAKNAKAAADKAAASGSEADRTAANLAAKRAEIAQSEMALAASKAKYAASDAQKAKEIADKTKEPLKNLADKARASVIDEAKNVQKKSADEIKDAEEKSAAAKVALKEKETAAKEARETAIKAAAIAAEKQDSASIAAAKQAEKLAKYAENQVSDTKKQISEQEKRTKDAEIRILEAKAFESKITAEKDLGLTNKVEQELRQKEQAAAKQKAADDAEAERLRNQYAEKNNPIDSAEVARAKAQQANALANQTQNIAKQKESQAAQAKAQAEAAAKKAAQSGDAVSQRAAAQAAKRAELAAKEAATAKEKAAVAKSSVQGLDNSARSASIAESKYIQASSQEEVAKAETAIIDAKANAQKASLDAQSAKAAANEAAKIAATANTTETILAAKNAAIEASKKQQEALAAQKKIDDEIKRRNQAEMRYYEEATRQAELENPLNKNKVSTASTSGANVLVAPTSPVVPTRTAPLTAKTPAVNTPSPKTDNQAPANNPQIPGRTNPQTYDPSVATNPEISTRSSASATASAPTAVTTLTAEQKGAVLQRDVVRTRARSYETDKIEEQLQEKDEEAKKEIEEQHKKQTLSAQSAATHQRMEASAAVFKEEQQALIAQQEAEKAALSEAQQRAARQDEIREANDKINQNLRTSDLKKQQQLRLERLRQRRLQQELENAANKTNPPAK